MARLTLVFVVCLVFLPPAFAGVAPRKQERSFAEDVRLELRKETGSSRKKELRITKQTEVKLDGRVCQLEEVPANAEIILLDVGPDDSVIRKIHFRSKK
jgi:hypothetical protein